jgi:hypothetical protein
MKRGVRYGKIYMDMKLGTNHHSDIFNMGSNFLFDLIFEFRD